MMKKFFFFCIIGLTAFLIDWGVFNLFYFLGLGFISAKIISTALSMTFNFTTNRNYNFKANHHPVRKQVVKWLIVYGIAAFASISVGKIVLLTIGESLLNANIAFFVGLAISIPIDFLGSAFWVFRKRG